MPVADAELCGDAEPQPASERPIAAATTPIAAVLGALGVRSMAGLYAVGGASTVSARVTGLSPAFGHPFSEMRVLVVEDHRRLATAIAAGLRNEGIAVDVAFDGAQALAQAAIHRYDVVVLDRDLPRVHGDEVCRRLVAQEGNSRVLMLTASSTIADRVEGLGLGADDYLPKPFDFGELVARVRALARRAVPALPPTLARRDLRLDPARRVVTRGSRRLALTPKEFAVLECLLEADGRVLSAEELLARVWDAEANPFTTTVKTTIARLRAKLGPPDAIETVREGGYRI